MQTEFISLAAAKEMTAFYRSNLSTMLTETFKESLPWSETFSTSSIQAILDQTDCEQFRAYLGMKADYSVCLIFVGVNSKGEDIVGLVKQNSGDSDPTDIIVENGTKCPPYCPDEPL